MAPRSLSTQVTATGIIEGLNQVQVKARVPATIAVISYVTVPLTALVAVAVGTLILAAILSIIGTMAGGNGSFLQVWSVTLHASVPVSIVAGIIKALMILMTPDSARRR